VYGALTQMHTFRLFVTFARLVRYAAVTVVATEASPSNKASPGASSTAALSEERRDPKQSNITSAVRRGARIGQIAWKHFWKGASSSDLTPASACAKSRRYAAMRWFKGKRPTMKWSQVFAALDVGRAFAE
jgi:hypothetical protein